MTFLENYFPEAWYINLDDRTDRKEHMDRELAKYNMETFVQRYSAIKAEQGKCVIASGTSHRNLIHMAKDRGLESILILEDDIFFKDGTINMLEQSLNSLAKRNDWDIYYMNANIFDNPINLIDENLMVIHGCYCVHAYAVHSRAYDKVLQYNPQVDLPIDAWLTIQPLTKLGGYPLMVSQIDSVSDNAGKFIGYDQIFTEAYSRPVINYK
jgi:GR25 family glycosyltransferase involved in LPS biosynthesis